MKRSLQEVAHAITARLVGDEKIEVSGIASLESAGKEDLVFVEDAKWLAPALKSGAGAVIAGEFAVEIVTAKALLISEHPKLAFARAAQFLRGHKPQKGSVDPTAMVHSSARVADGATVAERALIGEQAEIGEGTWIGPGCVVGRGVKIGSACEIYPNVTIYGGTTLGNHVIVHAGSVLGSDGFGYVRDIKTGRYEKFPQIGRLVIEDDVEIGANTTIDRGALDETRIGRGTKIDNLVHIGHNCSIGEDVIIAAQTGLSGSVTIKKNVVLGGQVGIGEHARIEDGVMLGAQGGVPTNKILRGKGVAFWGTPARPLREYLKQLALLARLGKKE
jgi:UDP-3-O-[3-hydroxymyristoyl] glucosamine N-acyltransferase